jgi:outer membrane cobalamin receptor
MRLRPVSLILLAYCSSAFGEFSDTRTIEHELWEDPGVLVNRQGLAQQDLSIRGSSYTGSGIAINGLNLKVPYSTHFNSELPFLGNLLSAPQTRTGMGNVSGHLTGTADFNTAMPRQRIQASAGIGTKEHYKATLSGQTMGAGGFLDGEKARQIDHDANHLDRHAGGAHMQVMKNDWQIDLLGAHQQKEFGAQGYYGAPSNVYAEEQTKDSLIFFGATHGEPSDSFFRTSAAWREFDDQYQTTGVERDVRSHFGTVAVEGRTIEVQHIALNLRGDIENERIDGDIGTHARTRGSVLILPEARFERTIFKAGLNSVFQTSESAEFLPMAEIAWLASDNSTLYASYSENIQQPDYQTLNDNSLLQQQETQNTEMGFRQFVSASLDWRAAGFYRRLENASDWIAGTATDLGTLNVAGLESEISFYPSDELELRALYQWIHKDNDVTDGLYETDYPEHMLNFAGHWKFTPEFLLFIAQTLRYQTDNTARTSSDFGADASLGLHWFPRFAHNARLSFMVDNLWGSNFQAIPGLKPPERTVSAGITVVW